MFLKLGQSPIVLKCILLPFLLDREKKRNDISGHFAIDLKSNNSITFLTNEFI